MESDVSGHRGRILSPRVCLRGLELCAVTEPECVGRIAADLSAGRGGIVITVNLDHLRRYGRDAEYRRVADEAEIAVADGMALVWASRLQGTGLPERVTGSNLIWSLSAAAAAGRHRVFLLGGNPGTAEAAGEVLTRTYPGLCVAGIHCPEPGFEGDPAGTEAVRRILAEARPDLVFVALGSPKQELLMARLRDELPHAWWLGVGISFSFVSGEVRRAPLWVQNLGFEWLHRLLQEPRRLARRYLLQGLPFALALFWQCLGNRWRRSFSPGADAAGTGGSIGYFVPEFPGQTHDFFWRELNALRAMGQRPRLVSTRLPRNGVARHPWAGEARRVTHYLFPSPFRGVVRFTAHALFRPVQNARLAKTLLREGLTVRELVHLPFARALARWSRKQRITHLHVHSCGSAALIAMIAERISGVRYSLTLHGPLDDYGPHQALKWKHAAFGIVITETLLADVRHRLGDTVAGRCTVAPMGVDTSAFCRSAPYHPWRGGQVRLFSCGRLNPCKGHETLIRSLPHLGRRGYDVRLTIAGEDDIGGSGHRLVLEESIRSLGLSDCVALPGSVSTGEVRRELERAHVFVLASRSEPLGVAYMEAMAMEVPVVGVGAGGVPELIEAERDGLLVPPDDPPALAEAVHRLLEDPELACRFSRAGRVRVEGAFGVDRSAAELVRRVRGLPSDPLPRAAQA